MANGKSTSAPPKGGSDTSTKPTETTTPAKVAEPAKGSVADSTKTAGLVFDKKMFVMVLTSIEAVIFSVVIFLAVTAHTSFRPTFEAGNALAVKSAVQIFITIWVLGLIHKYSQRWLNKMRPKHVDWRWRAFDISTSFAPATFFVLAALVMFVSPTPFASWWKWFVALIAAIVIDALKEDIPTLRLLWQKKI